MYLKMFGLQEKPFHITPNPRFIFLSKMHKEAFAHLLYGVKQRVGFLSLIGEVGTGKTTVLRTLLKQLEQADYQVALIFNPCLSALELLQSIHREFAIPYPEGESNLASLHESLNHFLLEQRQHGKTVVLVIDEAQNLDPSVLEQLRLLSNLETETDKLLQLIIVGQPELDEVLGRHELRQLKQRLVVRYRLMNMDVEDTAAYVVHRLKVAGYQGGSLFSEKAMRLIYRLTKGLPRLINILCDRALLVAYSNELEQIDRKTVAEAQAELSGEMNSRSTRWLVTTFIIIAILILSASLQPVFWDNLLNRTKIAAGTTALPASPEVIATKSSPPVVQSPAVDPSFLSRIEQKISSLGEAESAWLASSAVLTRWGRPALGDYPPGSYESLEKILWGIGMGTIRFHNDPKKLLAFDTPAILTIVLPNLTGKRYLALLKVKNGQVLTQPALSADGWLPIPYLEQIWFSSAVIPWHNFAQLPSISTPGEEGSGVAKLQEHLTSVGYPDLEISGVYDRATILAVSDLQRRTGLSPDGRVGGQTLFQMYRLSGVEMPHLAEEVTP